MANEKLRWLIADVNPKEIASHIECGNLQSWCDRWRDAAYSCLKKEHNAVEVVRCKDCRYFYRDDEFNRAWCGYDKCVSNEVAVNGYCYRGERKDDERKAD